MRSFLGNLSRKRIYQFRQMSAGSHSQHQSRTAVLFILRDTAEPSEPGCNEGNYPLPPPDLNRNRRKTLCFKKFYCAQRIFRPSYRPALQHSCSRYHFPRISKIVVDGLRGHPSHYYPLCSKMSKISKKNPSNFLNFYLSFWLTLKLIIIKMFGLKYVKKVFENLSHVHTF